MSEHPEAEVTVEACPDHNWSMPHDMRYNGWRSCPPNCPYLLFHVKYGLTDERSERAAASLRERIDKALGESLDRCTRCKVCDSQLDAIMAVAGPMAARLAELENSLEWHTTCTSCAAVLDSSISERCRREEAEELLEWAATIIANACDTGSRREGWMAAAGNWQARYEAHATEHREPKAEPPSEGRRRLAVTRARHRLIQAAIRCLSAEHQDPHAFAEAESEYADEQLALAARELAEATDALADGKPVGWERS